MLEQIQIFLIFGKEKIILVKISQFQILSVSVSDQHVSTKMLQIKMSVTGSIFRNLVFS